MFYRPFIQRLAPLLTAYLLLVSLGLPLQRVYCACVGEQWLSLTATDHECHHASAREVKHEHSQMACCRLSEGKKDVPAAEDPHDCGNSEVLLAQLDADFLSEQQPSVINLASLSGWPPLANLLPRLPALIRSAPIRGPTPPPLLYGRDLLVAQQTFLI
jgi:hypothetical protein